MIDSHIHLSNIAYDGTFPFLKIGDEGFALEHGSRAELVRLFMDAGIEACIEPAIEFDSNKKVLQLSAEYPDFIFPAIGVHPTRTNRYFTVENGKKCVKGLKLSQRKELARIASDSRVTAIGETGLDYHFGRKEQHRLRQKMWFVWQIKLADEFRLPLILHIREADNDALRILRLYRKHLHGGVCHCFAGDADLAEKYIDLGFTIGIGGMLLSKHDSRKLLEETVARIPIESILLETDGPYVKPECSTVSGKQLRKARNTSLILPAVSSRIAALKGIEKEDVERITAENVQRVFGISRNRSTIHCVRSVYE